MLEKVLLIRYWRKGNVRITVEVVVRDLHLRLRLPQSQQYQRISRDHPVLHHVAESVVHPGEKLQGHHMFQLLQKTDAAWSGDAGVLLQITEKIEIEMAEEPEVRQLVGRATATLMADLHHAAKA